MKKIVVIALSAVLLVGGCQDTPTDIFDPCQNYRLIDSRGGWQATGPRGTVDLFWAESVYVAAWGECAGVWSGVRGYGSTPPLALIDLGENTLSQQVFE